MLKTAELRVASLLLLVGSLAIWSCSKGSSDAPDGGDDPGDSDDDDDDDNNDDDDMSSPPMDAGVQTPQDAAQSGNQDAGGGDAGMQPLIAVSPTMHAFGFVARGEMSESVQIQIMASSFETPLQIPLSVMPGAGVQVQNDTCSGVSAVDGNFSCAFEASLSVAASQAEGSLERSVTVAWNASEFVVPLTATVVDLSTALIGHWKFDEGTGTAALDSSGNGNHGTVVQGDFVGAPAHPTPLWAAGRVGSAVRLDGSDDWVRVSSSASLNQPSASGSVTVSAWVSVDRINALDAFNAIVSRRATGDSSDIFGLGLSLGNPAGLTEFFSAVGSGPVPLNTWTHLTLTYDGVDQVVYRDGQQVASATSGFQIASDSTPLSFGVALDEQDTEEHFSGLLDEVRLYSRVLTATQIQALASP